MIIFGLKNMQMMAVEHAKIVGKLSIRTNRGEFKLEKYSDGDCIACIGGRHWFEINQEDRELLAEFLVEHRLGSPNKTVEQSQFKAAIRRDEHGWGVNVSPDKRYYYATRDHARAGDVRHRVGEHGRIS